MAPVPSRYVDQASGEIDLDGVKEWYVHLHSNDFYLTALTAMRAAEEFVNSVESGVLDFDNLALDTADPLVCEVEAFVKAYRKQYGDPTRGITWVWKDSLHTAGGISNRRIRTGDLDAIQMPRHQCQQSWPTCKRR